MADARETLPAPLGGTRCSGRTNRSRVEPDDAPACIAGRWFSTMSVHAPPEEERDSLGHGVGVELEKTAAEPAESSVRADLIQVPFDPNKIDIITRTPTVELLLSRIRTKRIDLEPDFQRRLGIWNDRQQSRLIESLLLRIPLPTLYAAETDDEAWLIVDGIQRLTAITRFIEPDVINLPRLRLRGLEYLGKSYDGCAFNDLPGRLQTRLRETELVVHLIRLGTPEEVKFNIFARINTGGLPLSTQELRHALLPGSARVFLRELAESSEFKDATNNSVRDERMADREMILRFSAFRLNDPSQYRMRDFDAFLNQAMQQINALDEENILRLKNDFRMAMRAARTIFGDYAFRKQYQGVDRRYPINKAIFETMAVNLANFTKAETDILAMHPLYIQQRFSALLEDAEFDRAVSVATGDIRNVQVRFARILEMFTEVLRDRQSCTAEL
jgi:hypothetical protein